MGNNKDWHKMNNFSTAHAPAAHGAAAHAVVSLLMLLLLMLMYYKKVLKFAPAHCDRFCENQL